ncbi:hypothetical protein, partial [Peribacillus simplex]|uniref:hypothetical protein n=2 Tax=Bacillales TaxID=1385 RepID=UPI00162A9394
DAAPLLNKQYNNAGEAINPADGYDAGGSMKVKIKAELADDTLWNGTAFAPANGNVETGGNVTINEKAVT